MKMQSLLMLSLMAGLFATAGCDTDPVTVPSLQGQPTADGDTIPPGPGPMPGPTEGSGDKWAEHTQGLDFIIGYEEGMAQAQSEDKPALLFVTTTWCGYCKMLANESFNDDRVKEKLEDFVLVIVDGDVEQDVTRQLGVQGFPHVVFQSSEGDILGESRGYVPADQFLGSVNEALGKL